LRPKFSIQVQFRELPKEFEARITPAQLRQIFTSGGLNNPEDNRVELFGSYLPKLLSNDDLILYVSTRAVEEGVRCFKGPEQSYQLGTRIIGLEFMTRVERNGEIMWQAATDFENGNLVMKESGHVLFRKEVYNKPPKQKRVKARKATVSRNRKKGSENQGTGNTQRSRDGVDLED
jgi:hypothetical protein